MALLLLAYMIIAFVAGLVALAMPCCFSVLLPSYFAQSFKQKARLIGMTVVFSLGIATIMLPLALGVLALGQMIRASHSLVFVAGGFIMIILGFWTLWGKGMLPRIDFPVNLNKNDVLSVYTLGLFSGAATSCCAPVLAGVLVLTALSTSMLEGVLVGLTYVAGMVFPLFVVALAWDRFALSGESPLRGRIINIRYFGREFSLHSSKLIAGIMFVIMGIITVMLGLSGTMIPAPGSALIGIMQAKLGQMLVSALSSTSVDLTLVGSVTVIGGVTLGLVLLVRNRMKREREMRTVAKV